jgi:hypothetical protein
MQKTDPRTKRIAIAIGAVLVAIVALLIVKAVVKQHKIEKVPDHFARAEPRLTDRRAPWPPRFGVNANLVATHPDPAFRALQFHAIAASGLKWVRIGLEWPLVQPRRGPFDFSKTDAVVGEAAGAGLQMEAILQFTPTWASTLGDSERTPAKDPADTDRYARAVVARYGLGGSFWRENPAISAHPIRVWEIWNEANFRHFFAPRSGRTYAHHAVVVARAIRSVDPRARVLFSGLVGAPVRDVKPADQFLVDAMRAQPSLARLLDGVAMHSYGNAAEIAGQLCKLRLTMNEVGLARQSLVLNEFGAPTTAIDDQSRAVRLGETIAAIVKPSACRAPLRLALIAPYTWWSPRRNGSNPEQWFGIADDGGRPLLTGTAYVLAAAGAERAYPR